MVTSFDPVTGKQFVKLIAFIDNKSRKVLHFKLLTDHSSMETAKAALELFEIVDPRTIGRLHTDNGTEF
jgi:transposase InsO family protein